ncbi:MAG: N-acetylneuraminate synthase family protein [Rhodospirillaceae bacterium]
MDKFETSIAIRNKVISNVTQPYIIAEMACAHDGDLEKAKKLIDSAVAAGADAIQFEILDPDDNVVPDTEMYQILKKLYFSPEEWAELVTYARQSDIAVFNFAYDPVSLELGFRLEVDAVKLNSSDLLHIDMLRRCAEEGLPLSMGTGGSALEEVEAGLNCYGKHGGTKVILMQGVQSFPTLNEYARIRRMGLLRDKFNCLVGYADHTAGHTDLAKVIDLVALGAGATVLEKHITWDRSEKGIDHESALEPSELKDYVKLIREAQVVLGDGDVTKLIEPDEKYRLFQKKTVVAAVDISAGDVITRDKVRFLRDMRQSGVAPIDFPSLEGKRALNPVSQFQQIQMSDVS